MKFQNIANTLSMTRICVFSYTCEKEHKETKREEKRRKIHSACTLLINFWLHTSWFSLRHTHTKSAHKIFLKSNGSIMIGCQGLHAWIDEKEAKKKPEHPRLRSHSREPRGPPVLRKSPECLVWHMRTCCYGGETHRASKVGRCRVRPSLHGVNAIQKPPSSPWPDGGEKVDADWGLRHTWGTRDLRHRWSSTTNSEVYPMSLSHPSVSWRGTEWWGWTWRRGTEPMLTSSFIP